MSWFMTSFPQNWRGFHPQQIYPKTTSCCFHWTQVKFTVFCPVAPSSFLFVANPCPHVPGSWDQSLVSGIYPQNTPFISRL